MTSTGRFDTGKFISPRRGRKSPSAQWKEDSTGEQVLMLTEEGRKDFVDNITAPYTTWHPKLCNLADTHQSFKYARKLDNGNRAHLKSAGAQMVNLLAYHPKIAFTREDLEAISKKLLTLAGVPLSKDIIQTVNKTDQGGLGRKKATVNSIAVYRLGELKYCTLRMRHQDSSDKDWEKDNQAPARCYYKHLAEGPMEVGHIDPRKPLGPKGENSVMQPSEVNRALRDKYIMNDNGLPKRPMPAELGRQLRAEEDEAGRMQYLREVLGSLQGEACAGMVEEVLKEAGYLL